MPITSLGCRLAGMWRGITAMGALTAITVSRVEAQSTEAGLSRTLAAIASTPLGALTPVGPVMAASRDDALLFGFRLQYGARALPQDRSLTSYGFVATAQIQGGSLISATVGQQRGCLRSSWINSTPCIRS